MLPYQELSIGGFHLLVVEKTPGTYRLYLSTDQEHYCNYDTGQFKSLSEAVEAAKQGFDPEVFILFPYSPYSRREVLEKASHAFDRLKR